MDFFGRRSFFIKSKFLRYRPMNHFKSIPSLFLLAIIIYSCQTQPSSASDPSLVETKPSAESTLVKPKKSVKWSGTYTGTIPCDHCEGITIWLTLNPNETFELKTSYLGLNDARDEIFTGKFTWEKENSQISLNGLIGGYPGKFRLEENQLWYLDENGNFYQGPNSKHYLLEKWWN